MRTQATDLLKMPAVVKTLSGAVFDPRATRWAFHDGLKSISINFERLSEYATEDLIDALKHPLIWYAENAVGGSLAGVFDRLRKMLQVTAALQGELVAVIDSSLLISYRTTLTPATENRLGGLTAFLKKWHSLGAPGITEDAVHFIRSIRLKGCRKGVAVLTMDPVKGPLTDVERAAAQVALNEAFSGGTIPLGDYLLAWIGLLLGQRNIQYAMLKVCDVKKFTKEDGSIEYVLCVPRAKQQDTARREQFKERLIAPSIGKLLVAYAKVVRGQFEHSTEYVDDPTQAPLFPESRVAQSERPSFQCHASPGEIGNRITSIFRKLQVYSERTGEPIQITSKRLRHTVATSAAREGHGELIIAELLDHSDTQNVGVYVKATPEIVERIDRAIAIRMAPLAHAFAGTIIRNESEAIRGGDPTSRIVDPRFDERMKPMGNCGRNGSCGFLVPISCYTCKSFQAWMEGPHEAVLAHLIAERDRLMTETDERIASVNDRTILAVAEVVRQVREMRGEIIDDG